MSGPLVAPFLSSDFLSHSPPRPPSPTATSAPYLNQQPSRPFMNSNRNTDPQDQPLSPSPILDPPPGVPFSEFLKSWTDAHVARWLSEIKCGMHAEAFSRGELCGDVLLDLDQDSLKEINISSIGDRLRILNAVKILRQRAASKVVTPPPTVRSPESHARSLSDNGATSFDSSNGHFPTRREPSRPPPLLLRPNSNKGDLPDLIREPTPESGSPHAPVAHTVRPLPQPNQTLTVPPNLQNGTPSAIQISTPGGHRPNLPPLPPPPRGQPPPPPSNRGGSNRPWNAINTDAPAFTSQPLPPPPQNQGRRAQADPRTTNIPVAKPPIRPTSPLPPPRVRGPSSKSTGLGVSSPNNSPMRRPGASTHPYASVQATLHPPAGLQNHNLSPIEEAFSPSHQGSAGTPSPPSQAHPVGKGPFNTPTSYGTPSLDDLRRKLVKFVIPEEGTSFTIDVANCSSGQDIIEKILKKIGKGSSRNLDTDKLHNDEEYLSVDGWVVYNDSAVEEGIGEPLTDVQLLAICHAPDHPVRERGLTVRKLRRPDDHSTSPLSIQSRDTGQTSKATKRASSISILSSLGVRNPEIALSDPPSPTADALSPSWNGNGKRPSKLRNFFGQRPPSELITDHLPEFFPLAEKKILRTARHSMLMRSSTKRHSTASSMNPSVASRFSTSTQGSQGRRSISPSRASFSSIPPPLPQKNDQIGGETIPRMSISTEDGHPVDLESDEGHTPVASSSSPPQLLPPIPLGTGSFSDSIEEITGAQTSRPPSRAMSIASKRMSYMSELRSKRDRSDTASLMTVDEITAEVESRRVSKVPDMGNPDLDDWTKVDNEDGFENDDATEEDESSTLATEADEDEEADEEADDEDDEDSDDFGIAIPTRTAGKWIKGALIGAGSFGKVYLGMDASNGLLMAVKQVELPVGSGPNQERKKSMLSALEREIELLKNLQHENIVQYLYSSLDDEFLNIFLEYVPGGSVATLLQNYGAFEEPLVRNFVRQILQGLSYLHERDIIHRDIKGANILVDNKGGIKISDFGISKKVDDNLLGGNRLHRPSLQGSVFWMAPEVVKQTKHTKKADIWSLGCLVVEMLTGEHPWAQLTQMQAIFKIGSSERPAIPGDISTDAQDFLQRTFELNHEARPPADELLQHPWIAKKSKKSHNANSSSHSHSANASASALSNEPATSS